jgi:threonine aldolase
MILYVEGVMSMINFKSDYSETAHPLVLERLLETNLIPVDGYGNDDFTEEAYKLLKEKFQDETVDIHFLSGGTQTNLIAIAAFLRPHEAVITTDCAHIVVAETGAIEATGHKIYTVPHENGKLNLDKVKEIVENESTPFQALPRLVALTHATEYGSIYTYDEIKAFYDYCQEKGLYLYIDGARMGTGIEAINSDIKYEDLPKLCDAFYIGATKNGGLYGEAIVIKREELKSHFRWHMKQRGALLSKGKPLAIQFSTLFSEGLFEYLAQSANIQSYLLREGLESKGFEFYSESQTNLTFVILPNDLIKQLKERFLFSVIKPYDESNSVVRLVTGFATSREQVIELLREIDKYVEG